MPLPNEKAKRVPELHEIAHIETVNYPDHFGVDVVIDGGWAHHMQIRWFALRYFRDQYACLKNLNVSNLKISGRRYGIVMPVG